MPTSSPSSVTIGIIGVLAVIAVFALSYQYQSQLGGADSGQAGMATSSTIQIGPQENKTLFSANSNCANRVITTVASPITISFSTAVPPSGMRGVIQAASTTVHYDSDLYGCTAVTAYAFSSTTITIAEFSQ